MRLTKILILLVSTYLFFSCENILIEESNDPVVTIASLIWNGEYVVDGCGFTIEIASVIYKPENEDVIPKDYKKSSRTSVMLQYIDLKKNVEYSCGGNKIKEKGIQIISVIAI